MQVGTIVLHVSSHEVSSLCPLFLNNKKACKLTRSME